MSRYTFRIPNGGGERGLTVNAFYGEVGWDEELATFYIRLWRDQEELLMPAASEPLVSCGGRLCEFTDVPNLERCLATRSGEVGCDPAEIAAQWGKRLEVDRDRYMESLSVEQEMNLLARLVADS
jgi:hypothetical protein